MTSVWSRKAKKEFGPNQNDVDALLVRLEKVTQSEAMFLAGIAGLGPEVHRAREEMLQVARRGHREDELKHAQNEVRDWVGSWFSGGIQLPGTRDVSRAEAAVAAAPAVLDAIGALVLRDLLPPDDFETLIGPWNELTKR